MSRALITESYLTGIANAIRTKLGVQNTYTPPQMAAAIESIPEGGITPTGTKDITQNGTHDVTQYASANVNVQPNLQSKTVTQNGTITPDQGYVGLSSVVVNVSGGGGDNPFALTDYIESSGTQYINTGYTVTTGTRIEIVANVPDNSMSYPALFGARNNTSNEIVIFVEYGGRNIAMVWANGDSGFDPLFWGRGYIGKKCEYILGQNGVTGIRDKDNYGFKGIRTTGTGTSQPLYIFALNENGSPNSVTFCTAKLYRMRIYENDTLVHEYVPWTDGNDVVCLKDTVTDVLKYNSGTGVFVRGSDT